METCGRVSFLATLICILWSLTTRDIGREMSLGGDGGRGEEALKGCEVRDERGR